MDIIFRDRLEAGSKLAAELTGYRGLKNLLVLGLPRGGVVTGYEIARALHASLDIIVIRKIGFPGQPEFGIGAVSETGLVILNEDTISLYGVTTDYIETEIAREKEEIARRVKLYRRGEKIAAVRGKTVILVDDGVATGATLRTAISALRKENPAKLVVALPVAPLEVAEELRKTVDEFVCLETPADFSAVGSYYHDFRQVSDEEVVQLLSSAAG